MRFHARNRGERENEEGGAGAAAPPTALPFAIAGASRPRPDGDVAGVPVCAPPAIPAKLDLGCAGGDRHPVIAEVLVLEVAAVL